MDNGNNCGCGGLRCLNIYVYFTRANNDNVVKHLSLNNKLSLHWGYVQLNLNKAVTALHTVLRFYRKQPLNSLL